MSTRHGDGGWEGGGGRVPHGRKACFLFFFFAAARICHAITTHAVCRGLGARVATQQSPTEVRGRKKEAQV